MTHLLTGRSCDLVIGQLPNHQITKSLDHQITKSQKGFTLVEIIVVLSIVGVIAGAVTASFSKSFASRRVETSAWTVGAVLAEARASAMATGRPHRFVLDPVSRMYRVEAPRELGGEFLPRSGWGEGGEVLPSQVTVERMTPQGQRLEAIFDGQGGMAVPVRVVLRDHDDIWTVALGAVSGRLTVARGDVDPFDPIKRPDLALDGLTTDLPPLGNGQ